jgi:maltooligosyltrehalose synthase
LVVAPRFALSLGPEGDRPHVQPDRWNDTSIVLPEGWPPLRMRDAVTGAVHTIDRDMSVSTLLRSFPVALLTTAS